MLAKDVHNLTRFYGYEPADLVAKNELKRLDICDICKTKTF